jgi:hypothetical protein
MVFILNIEIMNINVSEFIHPSSQIKKLNMNQRSKHEIIVQKFNSWF